MKIQHELDAPPWRRFESILMATSKLIRRAYDVRLAQFGINLSEGCLLLYIKENGQLTQTQVAERIGMGRAPAGMIVDSLSERKLLRRLPNAEDRRVWILDLTAEGDELADRVAIVERRARAELRDGISREDREHLAVTLIRLQSSLLSAIRSAKDQDELWI